MVVSRRSLHLALLTSFLIHLLFIGIIFLNRETKLHSPKQIVEIEYLEGDTALQTSKSTIKTKPVPKTAPDASLRTGKPGGKSRHVKSWNQLKLTVPLNLTPPKESSHAKASSDASLGIEPGTNTDRGAEASNAPNTTAQDGTTNHPEDWKYSDAYTIHIFGMPQDASSPQGTGLPTKQIVFIADLWRKINQSIEDNPFLSEYGHTGQIFYRFDVDSRGRLDGRSFRASGVDNVLKVIGARAIRKALKNEDGQIRAPDKGLRLNARFTWSDYGNCAQLQGIQKNFLSFCHYSVNKRKSFSATEKTATYLNALKYGPGVFEEIGKYQREKARRDTQFDPFESYRRDPDWSLD